MGEKAAKVLSAHFRTFDALAAATVDELTEINDVGGVTAGASWTIWRPPSPRT